MSPGPSQYQGGILRRRKRPFFDGNFSIWTKLSVLTDFSSFSREISRFCRLNIATWLSIYMFIAMLPNDFVVKRLKKILSGQKNTSTSINIIKKRCMKIFQNVLKHLSNVWMWMPNCWNLLHVFLLTFSGLNIYFLLNKKSSTKRVLTN